MKEKTSSSSSDDDDEKEEVRGKNNNNTRKKEDKERFRKRLSVTGPKSYIYASSLFEAGRTGERVGGRAGGHADRRESCPFPPCPCTF